MGLFSDLGDVNRVLAVEVDLFGDSGGGGDFLSLRCCLDSMVRTWCLPSSLCEILSLLPLPEFGENLMIEEQLVRNLA